MFEWIKQQKQSLSDIITSPSFTISCFQAISSPHNPFILIGCWILRYKGHSVPMLCASFHFFSCGTLCLAPFLCWGLFEWPCAFVCIGLCGFGYFWDWMLQSWSLKERFYVFCVWTMDQRLKMFLPGNF